MLRFNKFWEPEPNSGCWLWCGAIIRAGYGYFRYDGKSQPAHRVSYEIHCGPIPAHLEPVSLRENILRGTAPSAIHARQTHCVRGHPFQEPNYYVDSRGQRVCFICTRGWRARKRLREVAA